MGKIKTEHYMELIPEIQEYIEVNNNYECFMVSALDYKDLKINFYIDDILSKQINKLIYFLENADSIEVIGELFIYINNGQHRSYQHEGINVLDTLDSIYINLCEYTSFFIPFKDDFFNNYYNNKNITLDKINKFIDLVKTLESHIKDNPLLMYYIQNHIYLNNIFKLFECIYNKKSFKCLSYE